MKYLIKILKIYILVLIVVFAIRLFIISPGKINGRSMEPTLFDEQFILINKISLLFSKPHRDDIVQLVHPETPEFLVKRIVGVPGDTITVQHSTLTIETPDEKKHVIYLTPADETNTSIDEIDTKTYILSKHTYFVLGDNYDMSLDSRHLGPIHRSLLLGTVINLPSSK